jgi:cobyrinic acid a,c-diamide synthase
MKAALPRLIIAAAMSGSGKTTLTTGLIAALAARGVQVAPFKCGPDYVDPSYHALAAGRPCANLDGWMLPEHAIAGLLVRRAQDADLALIEGVMGLFDGYAGDDDTGSTAHIARLTATPVVLVLDVQAMARTAAALVAGLRDFDRRVRVAGVLLNQAGSPGHAAMVCAAIEGETGVPVLGYLLRDQAITLPERHLGLVPTVEPGRWQAWIADVAARVANDINLDRVLALARTAPGLPSPLATHAPWRAANAAAPLVAVAADEAFSFRYQDNLDLLQEAGAAIAPFSPLRDAGLPAGTRAVYLCGGFPELYAEQLSRNRPMRTALRAAAQAGLPIYAECGGLMYLTEAVVDPAGSSFEMVGALPGRSLMTPRLTLGYRTVRALEDSWLWRSGETLRGHEFHYSICEGLPDTLPRLYGIEPDVLQPEACMEGVRAGNVLASYVHLHFLSKPELATRFVEAAERL